MTGEPRYAIYYAPAADSSLARFGASTLGYDAQSGEDVAQNAPELNGVDWRNLTEEPRRYGFHATLKAPFCLRDGQTEEALLAATEAIGRSLPCPCLGALRVEALDRFVALVPTAASEPIMEFASRVVAGLESFRAPLSPSDMARRLSSPLTPRQKDLLREYGYPYVLDQFRFHMTLTGPIPKPALDDVVRVLRRDYLARVADQEFWIDGLAVFRQRRRDERFRIIARIPVGGAARE